MSADVKLYCMFGYFHLKILEIISIFRKISKKKHFYIFRIFILLNVFIVFFFRRKDSSESESIPFLNKTHSGSPIPTQSVSTTVNRTLLHHQQNTGGAFLNNSTRNGLPGVVRGLAYNNNNDSPPPDYNIVMHDTIRHDFFFFLLI